MNDAGDEPATAHEPQRAHQRLQAEVWEPEAEILLDRIGLEPGWTCVDLGCGAIGILANLARRVGAEGRVIGVDRELDLTRAARDEARREGHANVHLVTSDLLDPSLRPSSFDLVHARFVLHMREPERAIARMVSLARPGGTVAVQEPDLSTWGYEPECPSWARLSQALAAAIARAGDPHVGLRMPEFLARAGVEGIASRPVTLEVPTSHPHARLPLAWIAAQHDAILDDGLATERELHDAVAALERHLGRPDTVMTTPTTIQAWGRRPG
jgi:SAM-dependent methyltransferase